MPFLDCINLLEKKSSVLNILYTGKIFAPVLFSPLSPSFSGGEYKTWQIPVSQIINLFNTNVSGQIQDWAKLFAIVCKNGEHLNTGQK